VAKAAPLLYPLPRHNRANQVAIVHDTLLRLRGIKKSFPGVLAVDDVDLELREREVLALVGENGAGKSTLMKILSGAYAADSGSIFLGGRDLGHYSTREAIEMGIGVIYQELNYLNDLSIAENIFLGKLPRSGLPRRIDYRRLSSDARLAMDKVGLSHRDPMMDVGRLSVAEKQLVEIARAVSRNVRILVMDEPTSALNERETENLFGIIRNLRSAGTSIIYISHRMEEIFAVSDRVQVMRDGRSVAVLDTPATSLDEIVRHMVGRDIRDMYPPRHSALGEVAFEVSGLCTSYIKGASFSVRKGEVLGLFGLMGSGRTEIARCIYGAQLPLSGDILVEGRKLSISKPADAIAGGIAYVPAERKSEGLNLIAPVKDNITISVLKALLRFRVLDLGREKKVAEDWVRKLAVKTASIGTETSTLSGGNQQKIVIAKCMITDPKVMILNDPTRGVDVGSKVEIYNLINELCDQGKVVILISSELAEIMALSDRIVTVCEGRLTAEIPKSDFSQERILMSAIGE
jgi:ABC-type sugar transport system ATPase subunit